MTMIQQGAYWRLLRFDLGGPDDLAPFLGLRHPVLAEVRRRSRKRHRAERDKLPPQRGIGESNIVMVRFDGATGVGVAVSKFGGAPLPGK